MKRTNDLRDRAGGSDPRKSKEDEAVDRISGLPDSLLLHILSFLPFRCAVCASLMLRPFHGLWASLSSLSFEERNFHTCDRGRPGAGSRGKLWNFIDRVLALHESPEIHRLRSPLLKKVSLRYCSGLRVLKLDRHPSLEELNVGQCVELEKVDLASSDIKILAIFIAYPLSKIICPNVLTLELDGPKLDGENLDCGSYLNDVALYFHGYGDFFLEDVEVETLLGKLRNIAYFSLANWIMLVFSRWKLMNKPRPSFNWKSVTMMLDLAKWHLPGISYLLKTCDFLETLTIYVYLSYNDIQQISWDRACNFDGRSYWYSVEGTFHCLAHHLKKVTIYACVTEPYVIGLIKFLLGNALVLETMVISTKRNFKEARNAFSCFSDIALETHFTLDMLLDFPKRVSSFPRTSPQALVHLI